MRCPAIVFGLVVSLACGGAAMANDLVVTRAYSPIVSPTYFVPQTVFYGPAPPVLEAPVAAPVTTYYSPTVETVATYSPVVAPAPVVTYSPIVMPAPVVTYYAPAPTVTYYAAPTVVYSPPVYGAPAVVTTGRPVIVRPKVYIPGQPIRNVLRAITP